MSDMAMSIDSNGLLNPIIFPPGMILMFEGSISEAPYGWSICDGTNGTPDLSGRIPRGALDKETCGTFGGKPSIKISAENMPEHTHDAPGSGYIYMKTADSGYKDGMMRLVSLQRNVITSSVLGINPQKAIDLVPPYVSITFIMKMMTQPAYDPVEGSVEPQRVLTSTSGTVEKGFAFPDGVTVMWMSPSPKPSFSIALQNWENLKEMGGKFPKGISESGSSGGASSVVISAADHYPDHTHTIGGNFILEPNNTGLLSMDNGANRHGVLNSLRTTSSTFAKDGSPSASTATISIQPEYLSVLFFKKKSTSCGGDGSLRQLMIVNKAGDILGLDFPPGMLVMWHVPGAAEPYKTSPPYGWRICEEFKGKFPLGYDGKNVQGGSNLCKIPMLDHSHNFTLGGPRPERGIINKYDGDYSIGPVGGSDPTLTHDNVYSLGYAGNSTPIDITPHYTAVLFLMKL